MLTVPNATWRSWLGTAAGVGCLLLALWRARREEHRRREQNQPHTLRDSAALLCSALFIVGTMYAVALFAPSWTTRRWYGGTAVLLALAAGLTYLFSRKNSTSR